MIFLECPDEGMLFNYLDSNKQLAYMLQTERESEGEVFNYFQVSKDHVCESKQMECIIYWQYS